MIYPNTILSVSVYDYALMNRYIIIIIIPLLLNSQNEFTYFRNNYLIQNYKQTSTCSTQKDTNHVL